MIGLLQAEALVSEVAEKTAEKTMGFGELFMAGGWLMWPLLLLGGLILAIGMLISAFTESQFIAALGTFAVSFSLLMIDQLTALFASSSLVATVVEFLSVTQRYSSFTVGLIEYDNVFFFASMSALFLFFTVRVLDRRRWA